MSDPEDMTAELEASLFTSAAVLRSRDAFTDDSLPIVDPTRWAALALSMSASLLKAGSTGGRLAKSIPFGKTLPGPGRNLATLVALPSLVNIG